MMQQYEDCRPLKMPIERTYASYQQPQNPQPSSMIPTYS